MQRGRVRRGEDPDSELVAEGLEQRLQLALHALRDDLRALAEPRGLQGAVEGSAAGAARAVLKHVSGHVADGRVVEAGVRLHVLLKRGAMRAHGPRGPSRAASSALA